MYLYTHKILGSFGNIFCDLLKGGQEIVKQLAKNRWITTKTVTGVMQLYSEKPSSHDNLAS